MVGGPDDGTGAATSETALFEVAVSCDHGALTFEVEISTFLDLLAAMTVLNARHDREFECSCVDSDEAVARHAVRAWRATYGRDPELPRRGER
jgi:hypothetical protein